MCNFVTMKERINWIDWVKATCMTVVVLCHCPQQEDAFHLQYLASVILSSFFFVSGYLKKPLASNGATLKKYGYTLLIPYLIYNAIYYPYWFAKFYIEHGAVSLTDALKPIVGTLLLQLNTNFSCELNGVTWFLPALFLMHWITDICNRRKYGWSVMLMLSIICMILYGANKFYHFAPFITFHGFVRCLCFFFLGNLFRKSGIFMEQEDDTIEADFKISYLDHKIYLLIGIVTLILSILLFDWHINESNFPLHIILFYVVNFFSVSGIVYLFRGLDKLRFRIITVISEGTMIVFGLHRILIGIIDFAAEKLLHIEDITYNWYETVLIAVAIEAALIPLITVCRRKYPIMLGKRPSSQKALSTAA